MSLDPQREALVRRMVLNPSTWPNVCLSMKQIQGDQIIAFGEIHRPVSADQIFINGEEFDSIEALIAAGWAVD